MGASLCNDTCMRSFLWSLPSLGCCWWRHLVFFSLCLFLWGSWLTIGNGSSFSDSDIPSDVHTTVTLGQISPVESGFSDGPEGIAEEGAEGGDAGEEEALVHTF